MQGGSASYLGRTGSGITISGSSPIPVATSPQKSQSVSVVQPAQTTANNYYNSPYNPQVNASTTTGPGTVNGPTISDPYAAWGGQQAYNSLVSGFNNQKNTIMSTAGDAANNAGIGLNNSILDLIDSLRTGQGAVDNRGINNELAKQRGVADVYGSISRGIQSGGVTLANRNASDSSAAGAIARAYGSIGQRQMSDIGNQYELENQDITLAQQDLDMQRASGVRKIQGSKEQVVNNIVADAHNQLAALDAAMANASLTDRIAIDQEKSAIRQDVLNRLAQYDGQLTSGVSGINAMDQNARISEATRRGSLGQAPASQFNYTTETPVELQGTGPFASDLPIFTYRNRRQ